MFIRNFSLAVLLGSASLACLMQPLPCRAQATSYNISTYAGSINATASFNGDGLAPQFSEFNAPVALTFDSQRNLYIVDQGNVRIRKISAGKITTIAGTGFAGYSGDNGSAVNAQLSSPSYVRVDPAGNVYIADTANDVVRRVSTGGTITTYAGVNGNYSYFSNQDGGPANQAYIDTPGGLALDAKGNLYVADPGLAENRVRVISSGGIINTFAGNGWQTYQGDGGQATAASVYEPLGMAVDSAGNLYIADSDNHRIRKVDTNGIITTVAGTGTAGYSGDGGAATKAQLNRPFDVQVDSSGDLFIADYYNQVIRMVDAVGNIHTIAGTAHITGICSSGCPGDGGAATSAKLNYPTGIAVDTNGNVYIADSSNNVIRLLTPTGPAISNVISASGYGCGVAGAAFCGFTSAAPGTWVEIYGSNLSVDTRQWAASDFQGATAPTQLDNTSVTIGGLPAYVSYISGGQVNALVPSGVGTGQQQVVVKTAAGSATSTVNVNSVEPGLLSPVTYNFNGTQYVVAQVPGSATLILPVTIPGYTTVRAQPGNQILLYGIGFGTVSPNTAAGQPGPTTSALTLPFTVQIGGQQAQVVYDGLAPTYYGLYAFQVVVPSGLPANDKTPVTFSLNGTPSTQTLYLAVQ